MNIEARPLGEARQAIRGHGVRYVLAVSVTLAVVAMLIANLVA